MTLEDFTIASTQLIITLVQTRAKSCVKLHKRQTHKLGKINLLKMSMTWRNLTHQSFLPQHLGDKFLIGIYNTLQKIEFQAQIKTMLSLQLLIIHSPIEPIEKSRIRFLRAQSQTIAEQDPKSNHRNQSCKLNWATDTLQVKK